MSLGSLVEDPFPAVLLSESQQLNGDLATNIGVPSTPPPKVPEPQPPGNFYLTYWVLITVIFYLLRSHDPKQ